MTNADLLIKGGRVIDPSRGIDQVEDIAVIGKKIVAVAKKEDVSAKETICADGCIVTPGLIDIHCHLNYLGSIGGVPADLALLPSGVTAAADAGSTGVSNYPAMDRQLALQRVKTRVFLNVSAGGQIMSRHFSESLDYTKWEKALFDEAIEESKGKIIGFKIRVSNKVVKDLGMQPLEEAVKLSAQYDMPLVVHPSDPPVTMGEVVERLKPGDILCHMYTGMGKNHLVDEGHLSPGVVEGRKRGVLFDVAHGGGNFNFSVAEEAIRLGFYPDFLSSDLSAANWNKLPLISLLDVMSKFLYLGFSLYDVISMVTVKAAQALKMEDEWGTLRPGTVADIAILKEERGKKVFEDHVHNHREGNTYLTNLGTILDGKIVFRSGYLK